MSMSANFHDIAAVTIEEMDEMAGTFWRTITAIDSKGVSYDLTLFPAASSIDVPIKTGDKKYCKHILAEIRRRK